MKRFLAIALAVLMTASLSVVGMAADEAVRSIYFAHDEVWLRVGNSRTILPEVIPGNAARPELEWRSTNEAIATVDSTGKVTGLSAGTTAIIATTTDGEHTSGYTLIVRAGDSAVMEIQGVEPGGEVTNSVSVNSEEQAGDFYYHSLEEVRSATFKAGKMVVTEKPGNCFSIKPAVPKNELTDIGTPLTDTLEVTLADGTKCEFSVKITFTNKPYLKFVGIEGHPKRFHGEVGVTYPYIFEIVDKANLVSEIIGVDVWVDEEPDNPELPPIVNVGEEVINGKRIVIPFTPARNGDAYLSVHIDSRTAISAYPDRTDFSWHMDIGPAGTSSGNTSGSDDKKGEPSVTDNVINTEETIQAIAYGDELLELKVTNGSAGIGLTTMDTLGNYHTTISVQNGSMRVDIPGGFGKVTEPGRIYYPMDFMDNLANAAELAAPVKGDNAKTEVVKAGGDMVMPTTVTVTLKTRLTGTVRVYYYNPETRRYTLIASPTAQDGKITFATRQMGTLVLTTGTI